MDLTDAIIDYRRFLKRKNYSAHTVKNIIQPVEAFCRLAAGVVGADPLRSHQAVHRDADEQAPRAGDDQLPAGEHPAFF